MIRHVVKMVWNRKRASALIVLEVAVSFLVLFAVSVLAVFSLTNARRPLGYDWRNVIAARLEADEDVEQTHPEAQDLIRRLLEAARELPEVEAAASIQSAPYSLDHNIGGLRDRRVGEIEFDTNEATDDLPQALGLTVTRGRWFTREDRGAAYRPVVINERMARFLFGQDDPIGKRPFELENDGEADGTLESRIVGVISDFRQGGELSAARYVLFHRADLEEPGDRMTRTLLVRVRPGTPRSFEPVLAAALQGIARNVSFEIAPLEEMRATTLLLNRTPVIVVSVIAVFLMIMVGLGLTGVLWQNVTQRTMEIGLRRAKGATEADIYFQILGELFVIASIGILLGGIVALQVPLLGLLRLFGPIGEGATMAGFVASAAILYALTLLCGLYPSRLAARIQPAEALHYE